MAQKKFRLGMIGCGSIAEIHIKNMLNIPDIEIVAGVDIIPGKAAALMAKYGIDAKCDYKTHEELIDDKSLALDGVSICTYNCEHAAPAIYALDHGINVLLEKPFTVTLDEAVEVMRAEKRSGKILSIGFQPRFEDNMKKIKSIVSSGVLGKVYYVQTGGGRRRGIPTRFGSTFIEKETAGVGALGDIGCYALDMVLNAIGYPRPLTVSGRTTDYFGKSPETYADIGRPEYAKSFSVDDFASAYIRLEGDVILDFRISWHMHMDTTGDTLLLGTKGGLRIPSTECWNGTFDRPMTLYRDEDGKPVEITIPLVPQTEDLWDRKIRSFLDAILTGGPSPVPSGEILYNQAIIDGILRSSREGREVTIELPEI